jgi:hypothetical protein
MAWPATLDYCKLRLVFEGVVLRVNGDLVIVTIMGPEFRTAGRSTSVGREELATVAGAIDAPLWPMACLLVQ